MTDSAGYVKIVEWSEEDQSFVGQCPEIVGPCCHGADEAEVYRELCRIVEEWIEIARQDGRPLPPATAGRNVAKNCWLSARNQMNHVKSLAASSLIVSLMLVANSRAADEIERGMKADEMEMRQRYGPFIVLPQPLVIQGGTIDISKGAIIVTQSWFLPDKDAAQPLAAPAAVPISPACVPRCAARPRRCWHFRRSAR